VTDDGTGGLDPDALREHLARFGGSAAERRAVARAARDLADDGRIERDLGAPLSVDLVVSNLADAREGGPADRWNWWLGSLSVAFGDYRAFEVRRWPSG
jgi:hypothetical protein